MRKGSLVMLMMLLVVQVALGRLQPDFKFPPNTIAAPTAKGYSIVVNIPERQLYLFSNGALAKKYPVAVGKADTPTPVGRVKIINKLVNPTWYPKGKKPVPSGPDNPLGNRWLGLSLPGYGIHGNNRPSSIGTAVSLGCIRMLNPDVEELFKLVSVGTIVDLIYETVLLERKGEELEVQFAKDIYHRKPHQETFAKLLKDLPVSKFAQGLIGTEGGAIPWQLKVKLPSGTFEGFYWEGKGYLPLSPLIEAFRWQREGNELIVGDERVVVDVVAGGELYFSGDRLYQLMEKIPRLNWEEQGLTIKIQWQEGETPPFFMEYMREPCFDILL